MLAKHRRLHFVGAAETTAPNGHLCPAEEGDPRSCVGTRGLFPATAARKMKATTGFRGAAPHGCTMIAFLTALQKWTSG